MTKSLTLDRFQLGVCYYPEHWPEELWADDFRRMRELGFSVIRIAEFAWTIFEPEEGTLLLRSLRSRDCPGARAWAAGDSRHADGHAAGVADAQIP